MTGSTREHVTRWRHRSRVTHVDYLHCSNLFKRQLIKIKLNFVIGWSPAYFSHISTPRRRWFIRHMQMKAGWLFCFIPFACLFVCLFNFFLYKVHWHRNDNSNPKWKRRRAINCGHLSGTWQFLFIFNLTGLFKGYDML